MAKCKKYIPGSDADSEDIFTYPFIVEDEVVDFINDHGKIMFIIRGPPGTAKRTLSYMIKGHYPTAVLCSADLYFTDTFDHVRTSEKMKESHKYCAKKARIECVKGTHPIIVQNTHVRKMEMQIYLDLAAEFNYTIILMNTSDKFKVTPSLLAKSNTKGLKEDYFKNRLKQWENVSPVFTGWFICPKDCSYLLFQLQLSLEILLGDKEFSRVFKVFSKDELMKRYMAKKLLCCVAGYGQTNNPKEIEAYCLSEKIKDSLGQCFTIAVHAYLITVSDVFAVVHLDDVMNDLIFIPESEKYCKDDNFLRDIDNMIEGLGALSLCGRNISKYSETVSFGEVFSDSSNTAHIKKCSGEESINIDSCSFIHLAEEKEKVINPAKLRKVFDHYISSISGGSEAENWRELKNQFKVIRLSNDGWFIKPPFKIFLKTVFTGLYI